MMNHYNSRKASWGVGKRWIVERFSIATCICATMCCILFLFYIQFNHIMISHLYSLSFDLYNLSYNLLLFAILCFCIYYITYYFTCMLLPCLLLLFSHMVVWFQQIFVFVSKR